jgi:SPP1 gp7 family putative phage head morphogenesis protein
MDYATGGRRYADLVDMIRNTTGVTVSRATLIARTETAKAQSAIVQARSQTLGIEGYIWRTVMDIDVRPEHQRLEGTFHRWDDPPVAEASGERHHPGAFPNCFTEETVIDLRFGCRGLYRAFYDGPLVTLIIGSSVIEVTPNHPIRTISGWVPAGLLNKGDKVICIGKQAWEIGDDSIDNTKPSFINLFESLWPFCSSRKVFAGGNFYGDIVKNDVDHITFNPVLSGYLKAGFFQDITQFSFTKANSRIWDSSIISRQSHSFESTLPSRLNTIPVLLCGLVSRDELVSLKHCPSNDSISTEDIAYGSHRTLMPFSQGGSTYSTGIVGADTRFRQFLSAIQSTQTFTNTGIDTEGSQLDTELVGMTRDEFSSIFDSRPIAYQLCCVLDKSFRNFSGHVYTMETDTGYYAAGKSKILAKNCRCYAEPLLPEVRF